MQETGAPAGEGSTVESTMAAETSPTPTPDPEAPDSSNAFEVMATGTYNVSVTPNGQTVNAAETVTYWITFDGILTDEAGNPADTVATGVTLTDEPPVVSTGYSIQPGHLAPPVHRCRTFPDCRTPVLHRAGLGLPGSRC